MPLLYLWQAAQPDFGLGWAFMPKSLAEGTWWPGVLTAMFLHAGWAHVGMNALGALAFAPPVARVAAGLKGALAFFAIYIVCGVVSAAGYGLLHMDLETPMVGASGAVFGLVGAAIRLLGRKYGPLRPLNDRQVLTTSAVMMGVNAALGLANFAPGMEDVQVAWEAHAIGYVFGLLMIGPFLKAFGRFPPRPSRFPPAFDSRPEVSDAPDQGIEGGNADAGRRDSQGQG